MGDGNTPEFRLSAATHALAEHDHLRQARDLLAADVRLAEQRVQHLAAEFAREQRDVHELTTGVLGFLSSLTMTGEIEREQREAVEAGIRLREAQGAYDGLRVQLSVLDQRLATPPRAALEAELSAARAAKEAALRNFGGPGRAQLIDLDVQLESIDIELIPLQDAVTAGTEGAAVLFHIVDLLDRVGAAPAKGVVGDAQAKLTLFHRAVDALVIPDDTRPPYSAAIAVSDREPWVDPWLKQLFGSDDRAARHATARSAIVERLHRIKVALDPVVARRDELAARYAAVRAQRDQLIAPA